MVIGSLLVIILIFITLNYIPLYFETKKMKNNAIGIYLLDLNNSRISLKANDSLFFKDLTFTLTVDSFHFSKKVPYECDTIGTWETQYVDPSIYFLLKFRKGCNWQIGPSDANIDMPYWFTIEKYPQKEGMLHFIKKK